MKTDLCTIDKVEILTLQDNTIDLLTQDNGSIINRASPVAIMKNDSSILAEHGFSSLVNVHKNGQQKSLLFDFGLSEFGAAFNADALGTDLSTVETMVLSHGHFDHFGGITQLAQRIDQKGIPLVLHPAALRAPRFMKGPNEEKIIFPALNKKDLDAAGILPVPSPEPTTLLDNMALFLGEIPKANTQAPPLNFYYEADGEIFPDPIEDDSAIVFHVDKMGLVILAGCAHSGIVNIVNHAKDVTGVNEVFAVMGGFHLSGADFQTQIAPTISALKSLSPGYVVPAHCTGREAIMHIEREMPEQFLLNMSGTQLTFSATG